MARHLPQVSVIINTLNRADYLNDAILGVRQLDYPAIELVVVNGPSTDWTEEVLAKWGNQIKLRQCKVPNLSVSRNVGISAASGEIVAFLDDDAVPHPRWLSALVHHYNDPQVGGVGGFTVDNTGVRWQVRKTICDRYGGAYFVDDFFDERNLNFPGSPFFPSLLGTNSSFRRTALEDIGGFDHTFAYLLDETDVCLRLVDAGWKVAYEASALVFHQFAESHVRSNTRKPRTLYPSVVSKVYFIHRHGRNEGLIRQARAIEDYRDELIRANQWLEDQGDISHDHRISLDLDVEQGIETGSKRSIQALTEVKISGDLTNLSNARDFLPMAAPEQLRVALVVQGFPPENDAGIARWTALAARGLADLGVQVHVITRAHGLPSRRFKDGFWLHCIATGGDEEEAIGRIYDVPGPDLARWMAAVTHEIRFLKTFGLDLVSFPIWDLEALPVLDDPTITSVLSLHTSYLLARPFKPEWNLRVVFGRNVVDRVIAAERAALARAQNILANSQCIVSEIEQGYGVSLAGRCHVVPHGTTDILAKIKISADEKLAANAARGGLRVLVPGRFELRKGYDLALRLAASLVDYPTIHFDFVGQDVGEDILRRAADESGIDVAKLANVGLLGMVGREELEHLYVGSDVVLMFSRFESFGLVAIEAMSAATPVIALAAGALCEVVEDTKSGWLIQEDDLTVANAATVLKDCAEDRCRVDQFSRAAYAAFNERFTCSAMAGGIREIYRAAILATRGGR